MISMKIKAVWNWIFYFNQMLFQGEVYYGDILESSQIVCVAEMSPHSAKFSWSFKVGGGEN